MTRFQRPLGWTLVAAAGYGALYWWAQRAAYFPMRYPEGWWDRQGETGAHDAAIATADGVRLHGWWLDAPGSTRATLFLHGNAGNVTHRAPAMREIAAAGSSVLVIDYRGYGRSEGSPSERGLYRDSTAAYEWLRAKGYPPQSIFLHGESLGSAVAVELAARVPCAAVILEAPFSSGQAMAGRVLPLIGPLVFRGFDSLARIRNVRVPLLFIQGTRDEVVPIELGRRLYAAANQPKAFWEIPAAHHNDILETAGPAYREKLREFYSSR